MTNSSETLSYATTEEVIQNFEASLAPVISQAEAGIKSEILNIIEAANEDQTIRKAKIRRQINAQVRKLVFGESETRSSKAPQSASTFFFDDDYEFVQEPTNPNAFSGVGAV